MTDLTDADKNALLHAVFETSHPDLPRLYVEVECIVAARLADADALAAVERGDAADRADVAAWLRREADKRVHLFPQRRDGVDAILRSLATALSTTIPEGDQHA